jgi:hypothetical protein
MTTEEIINGLKHTRNDHPCCDPFLSEAIRHLETEQARFPSRDLLALKIWLANLPQEMRIAQSMAFAEGERKKLREAIRGAYELADFYLANVEVKNE